MKLSAVRGTHFHYKPPKITLPGEVDGRSLETNPDAVVAVEWLATCRDWEWRSEPRTSILHLRHSLISAKVFFHYADSATMTSQKACFWRSFGDAIGFFLAVFLPGQIILKHAPKKYLNDT